MTQFERDLLIGRTNCGLARVKAAGEKLGRPKVLDDKKTAAVNKHRSGAPAKCALNY
jgi:putative DNA-invertase from lambdoid prophage Rac